MNVDQTQPPNVVTGTGGGIPEIQPTDRVVETKRKLTDVGARIMSGSLAKDLKRQRNRPPAGHVGRDYTQD